MCVIRGDHAWLTWICAWGHGAMVGSQDMAAVFLPRVSNTCFGINQSGQLSRQREGMAGRDRDGAERSRCQV